MRRFYIARLSSKGQITIPAQCLRELGWIKGKTRLTRSRVRGGMVLAPVVAKDQATRKELTRP